MNIRPNRLPLTCVVVAALGVGAAVLLTAAVAVVVLGAGDEIVVVLLATGDETVVLVTAAGVETRVLVTAAGVETSVLVTAAGEETSVVITAAGDEVTVEVLTVVDIVAVSVRIPPAITELAAAFWEARMLEADAREAETAEESFGPGATTTGVAVAMIERRLDAFESIAEAARLAEDLSSDTTELMAEVAALRTLSRSPVAV